MQKKALKTIVVLVAVIVTVVAAKAEKTGWEKVKEKKGISLFSRQVNTSGMKEFKAVAIIDLPMEFMFEVLLDIENYPRWFPDCLEAKKLKSFDTDHVKGNFIVYFLLDAQWPVTNRDVIVRSDSVHDWDRGHVYIILKRDPMNYPSPKGVRRMVDFRARYDFYYITRTKTRVVYVNYAEIGGNVPAGLVNGTNKKLTLKTIIRLVEQAKKPEYREKAMRDYF